MVPFDYPFCVNTNRNGNGSFLALLTAGSLPCDGVFDRFGMAGSGMDLTQLGFGCHFQFFSSAGSTDLFVVNLGPLK